MEHIENYAIIKKEIQVINQNETISYEKSKEQKDILATFCVRNKGGKKIYIAKRKNQILMRLVIDRVESIGK